ncbi:DUF5658 family protein [Sulfitobacter dubius]|uniref:DUF5658 family protein n=1 Tax=Sulfitobacter dubius TaxID=218673 RepID=UPI00294341CB|nr:DUF5658 family protein [Sulfitobacter dubius]WOI30030.1 DUF5658 family protein [Sulfitobacter dubius]
MMFDLATFLALLAAQIADVVTTNRVLAKGGREVNPVMRWIMDKTGDQWAVIKVAAALFFAVVLWAIGMAWAIWNITALTWAVALLNWRTLRDMGG